LELSPDGDLNLMSRRINRAFVIFMESTPAALPDFNSIAVEYFADIESEPLVGCDSVDESQPHAANPISAAPAYRIIRFIIASPLLSNMTAYSIIVLVMK
jgi:hypothetical protein